MTGSQALALYGLLQTSDYASLADDAARLAKLNAADQSRTAKLISSAKLLEFAAANDLDVAIDGAIADPATPASTVSQLKTIQTMMGRDGTTLDMGNSAMAARVQSLVDGGLMTATQQTALVKLAWPTPAQRIIGKDADQTHIDAANAAGAAKAAFDTSAQTYQTDLAAAAAQGS